MKKKLFLVLTLILAASILVVGCGKTNNAGSSESADTAEDNKIVIGVSPVPHEEILEVVKDDFKEKGLEVEIVAFDDYVRPNTALAEGDLDANFFQHEPYLKSFIEKNNLKLVSIGAVHNEPMGFYSTKYKSLDELPEGAEILIPNDDTNGGRALLLLEANGLIKLKDSTNLESTEKDIAENPKNIKFTPVDAANVARAYVDVDGGVINSNFAIGAGLKPSTDSIVMEPKDGIYKNIVVVREGEENKEKFKKFMEVVQSEKVKNFLEEKYEGAVIPSF